jgi:hypothetical protein
MSKIKFKKILKEAAWDRTSGKALPTLDDVQKAYEAKKHLQEDEEAVNERISPQAYKRMDGLHHVRNMKSAMNFLADIATELEDDGFEADEIYEFFMMKIKRNIT